MPTRRDFVSTSGSALGGAWLARFLPFVAVTSACASDARRAGRAFVSFTPEEGADFEAFSARIVPSGDTPGAREAGSVWFADQALADHLSGFLPLIRRGLQQMNELASEVSAGASFAELDEASQDGIVATMERDDPGFFFFGRTLVVLGLITNPEYGGNRDKVGWDLIGFEDTYRYEPPFGYYDRDEHGPVTGSAEGDR